MWSHGPLSLAKVAHIKGLPSELHSSVADLASAFIVSCLSFRERMRTLLRLVSCLFWRWEFPGTFLQLQGLHLIHTSLGHMGTIWHVS